MNKKLLLPIGGLVMVVLLLGGGMVFLKSKGSSSLLSPVGQESLGEEEEVKLALWEDPAGFSFSYPEDVKIDPHEEDTENYAHLELTSPNYEGKIFIWVQDTDYTDIEDWVEKEATEGAQVFDTELGGEPAKKVAYSEPTKLVTAAIDIDALVLVEMMPGKEGYWQEIYDQILSSFTFVPLEGEEAAAPGPWEGAGGGGGIIEESEEVIE